MGRILKVDRKRRERSDEGGIPKKENNLFEKSSKRERESKSKTKRGRERKKLQGEKEPGEVVRVREKSN